MLEPGIKQQRINIPYLEGVNTLVSFNMGKRTEFVHMENARSKTVGTIEKREGQVVLGTNRLYKPFVTKANYGLFSFQNPTNEGFYRISANENSTLAVEVSDIVFAGDYVKTPNSNFSTLEVNVSDVMLMTESSSAFWGYKSTIYYIDEFNRWIPLTGSGTNIPGGNFDYTYAENCVFLSNLISPNRYISENGTTVLTSADVFGHLWNSPPASTVNYYKNRLYLGDFIQTGVRYKTTILRSSYPMGIISLLNEDTDIVVNNFSAGATGTGTVKIVDTKYMYGTFGPNLYEIYRGNLKMADMTVSTVQELSVTAAFVSTQPPTNQIVNGVVTSTPVIHLLASDEVWIKGTYTGKKVFRWVNNPSITGRDVKQYDTFKLAGGENDPITMLTNVGNIMMVANKGAMFSWNDYTLENFDMDIGCVSRNGYIKMLGTLYFIHYTGIYATTGSTPKIISNKIEKYITGATRDGKENSAAGKKGRSIFFTLGDVTLYKLDGSVNKILHDVCVEYNTIQDNWYVHTNVKASEFSTFIEEMDSDRLHFTDTAGNHSVKEFLSGETDDGDEIHFRVDTMKLTTQSNFFEFSSKPIALLAEIERGSSIQTFINLENNEEYYPVEGTLTKGLSIVKITDKDNSRGKPPVCRLISISLRDSSRQICKINRMTLVYIPTTDENMDNDN